MLRNTTSPMMHMKIYNETVQRGKWRAAPASGGPLRTPPAHRVLTATRLSLSGTNLCSNNNGDCSQLCLPTSPTRRACMCTAGYSLRSGQQSCEGAPSHTSPFTVREHG